MTLPDERLRSVNYARDFMRDLLDPKKTPKVPKDIRRRASMVLRHFPAEWEMEKTSEVTPGIFGPYEYEKKSLLQRVTSFLLRCRKRIQEAFDQVKP